jgi:MSHA biogenesis protein MshL
MLAGCQTMPAHDASHDPLSPSQQLAASLAPSTEAKRSTDIPSDVASALLPPINYTAQNGAKTMLDKRFDVVANNAPAREVFASLADGTPYSIVVHPDVVGTLTLDLKNVTVIEALEVLRNAHGYAYAREGNRIMILGQGMRTRIFPVNYLTGVRRGTSQTSVTSGELTSGNSGGSSSSGSGGAQSSGTGQGGVGVQTTQDASFWKELKDTLEAIIGAESGRKVVVNPQSNLVIVRALPAELDMVEDFLGLTHATINRQVILEAKILEVELSDGFQAGINWASLGKTGGTDISASQTGGGTLLNGSGVSDIAGNKGVLEPVDGSFDAVKNSATSAFGGIFSVMLRKGNDFSAFVELLKSQGEVQVLSSPRVSTVNNQKAVIKVGGDDFFVTGVTNSSSTTAANTTPQPPTVELKAFFSGIALDVTPQIDEHDNIILHIHPAVSAVTQVNKSFLVGSENYSLPLASSNIQESDNVVRAQTGQIIVIGGLMKEATTDSQASVPLLGDLPVIGALFKHTKRTRIKKELVILLKPTVIVTNDQWRHATQEVRDRVVNFTGAQP